MTTMFLLFTIAVALCAAAILIISLKGNARSLGLAGLLLWVAYSGGLGYLNGVAHVALPVPLLPILAGPTFTFALAVALSPAGRGLADRVPLWMLVGLQTFRLGLELFLYPLTRDGLIPEVATFLGGNVDILFGLTAPLIALLAARRPSGNTIVLVWNILGILSVLNASVRSALTAPGALHLIHSAVENRAMGMFPYTFIPAFLAPLALTLNILGLRNGLKGTTRQPVQIAARS